MARYTGPTCKLARREKTDLGLKSGLRSLDTKCNMEQPPGVHGAGRARLCEFGMQLREKQKVRRMYGVLEKQFRNYYKKASGQKGATGENLLQLLEQRLDNVVYRMGFASTRRFARQLVTHGHLLVDGKKLDIPSYRVKPGQKIEVRESSKTNVQIVRAMELTNQTGLAPWVDIDAEKVFGIYTRLPEREEVVIPVEERLIVELYSK